MDKIKAIIDYAAQGDIANMRENLYSSIMDKVHQAIDQKKIEVAANLFKTEEKDHDEDDDDDKKDDKDKDGKDKDDKSKSEKDKDDKKDDVNESLKHIKTYKNSDGSKEARVYKDNEWDEHRVKFYVNGEHQKKADYHTDEPDDAHGTAKLHIQEGIDQISEGFKIGDYVVTTIGPHAGVKHKVIHVHGDGKNYNIKPELDPKKVKYRQGAVKAHDTQISKWKDEPKTTKEEVEAIQELKKSTLGSYVKKATDKVADHGFYGGKSFAKGNLANSDYHAGKESKRKIGIVRAVDRLAKEEVEAIQEKSKEDSGHWIQKAIKKPGSLHKELGIPADKKIPEKELEKDSHAKGKLGKRARLALTLKGLH